MTSITEVVTNVVSVSGVVLSCGQAEPKLYPIKEAFKHLQLAIYWLADADYELGTADTGDVVHDDKIPPQLITPPTLISIEEHFIYIDQQLTKINEGIQAYTDSITLPPSVKYKVNRGYDNIMEAKFSTQIARKYYEPTRAVK